MRRDAAAAGGRRGQRRRLGPGRLVAGPGRGHRPAARPPGAGGGRRGGRPRAAGRGRPGGRGRGPRRAGDRGGTGRRRAAVRRRRDRRPGGPGAQRPDPGGRHRRPATARARPAPRRLRARPERDQVSAAGRWADRFGVAVGYTLALATGTALLHAQPRPTRDARLDLASTNLANATDHPFSTLLVSALFTDGDVRGWLVLSLVGLGTVGWRFGAWRTLTLVVAAHVLGTVISEGVVGIRIATGALPRQRGTPARHRPVVRRRRGARRRHRVRPVAREAVGRQIRRAVADFGTRAE